MERRQEPRISLNQPVRLTVLGEPEPERVYSGSIEDRSGRGMRVSIPASVAPGTAVRLDLRDEVAFGEVCYCQPLGNSGYALGLELDQSLKNLDDLTRLVQALLGSGARSSDREPSTR